MTSTTATTGIADYSDDDLALDLRWWAAANYLTVGQIYLKDNALLREPLSIDHVKPGCSATGAPARGSRCSTPCSTGSSGAPGPTGSTSPGPGHGGPALVAGAWLEGTYTETYPDVTTDADGLLRLFRQFSTPGGVPSHVSVQTPGSIHEGGELGYALAHAAGAASTIRTSSSPASSVTARPRPARWPVLAPVSLPQPPPRRGGPARSFTSTGTRSPARPSSGAAATKTSSATSRARAGTRSWSAVTTPRRSSATCGARSSRPTTPSSAAPRDGARRWPQRAGDPQVAGDHPADPQGMDRPRGRRRRAGRGDVPQPPGPAVGTAG